ncbi:MAG TPA: hypothetical protein ENH82_04030, partial [bacterium]|nr:hypothetical protein [bacterium]
MAKAGSLYESLVQRVFCEILSQSAVKTIEVERNVVLQGKTTRHEIDVYWEFELAGIKYVTVIQAKDWSSKVPQGEMLKLKGILDDLPGQPKGIFVTKTGYQRGAIDVAAANGIAIYEFREPTDEDWEGKLKEIHVSMHFFVPNIEFTKFEWDEAWVQKTMKEMGLTKLDFTIHDIPEDVWLYDEKGNQVENLQQVADALIGTTGMKEMTRKEMAMDYSSEQRFVIAQYSRVGSILWVR